MKNIFCKIYSAANVKRISESHSQGICPVCGEKMWSDEAVAQIEKGKWVHEYHCTPESIERLENYCEKYWDTHDNDKYFNPPMCELRQ